MGGHMKVQASATKRNNQVEVLINFIIEKTLGLLKSDNIIRDFSNLTLQKEFERNDSKEIFDHYVEVIIDDNGKEQKLELWGQTTCYKGNKTKRPEPNKTYEIRETITEALFLRNHLMNENKLFRTMHFTVGSTDYSYGWFKDAKSACFDLSLYPNSEIDVPQLFDTLNTLIDNLAEYECYIVLDKHLSINTNDNLTLFVSNSIQQLYSWFKDGYAINLVANLQANLLDQLNNSAVRDFCEIKNEHTQERISIKDATRKYIIDGECNDDLIKLTAKEVVKDFVRYSLDILENWGEWERNTQIILDKSIDTKMFLKNLWCTDDLSQQVYRRLLLRIRSNSLNDNYIQDLDINGVTEHNLYSGSYGEDIVEAIIEKIYPFFFTQSKEDIFDSLTSETAKFYIRSAIKFETNNGTNMVPSSLYLKKALSTDFKFIKGKSMNAYGIDVPISYFCEISNETVKNFTNIDLIVDSEDKPLAIIKAKFFRGPEFARRAKEEAFIGITSNFNFINNEFKKVYTHLPFIMFIDMPEDLIPSDYPLRRLQRSGWNVFFSIGELKKFLQALSNSK